VSDGVNVRPWINVPAFGDVDGVVQANDPGTLPTPPFNIEEPKVCP
jgi:hypothetical protein